MATTLTPSAVESSCYIVTVAFTDEDDTPVTPSTVTWSLTDSDGAAVNNRTAVSATPDTSIEIALTGNDLVDDPGGRGYLLFKVTAAYTSATFGAGIPLIGQVRIPVQELEP
jgi:hypothetical protein